MPPPMWLPLLPPPPPRRSAQLEVQAARARKQRAETARPARAAARDVGGEALGAVESARSGDTDVRAGARWLS